MPRLKYMLVSSVSRNRCSRLVYRTRSFLKDQVFHARVGELLTGLAEQHHQHHPLDLFNVDIRGLQRQQAVDQQFALRRRQDADLFEIRNVTATCAESKRSCSNSLKMRVPCAV